MMLNTLTQSAAANAPAPNQNVASTAQPAQAAPASAQDAQDPQGAQGAQQPVDAGAVQPFAQWLGQQAQAALQAVQTALPVDAAQPDATPASSDTAAAKPEAAADDDTAAASPAQDSMLLAAMAMPLMPLSPAQVAQAVQAAQPAVAQLAAKSSDSEDTGAPAAATQAVTAAGKDSARASANSAVAAIALPPQLEARPAQQVQAPAQADSAPAARPAAQPQQQALAPSAPDAGTRDNAGDRAGSASLGASAAALAASAPAQPQAGAPVQDTVKLAGPPTAWRQSLQEALGDRLHVQVGNNIEQAVIRLEPPQLGRIDIAIRHSAGTLEVNISATHGEVLRQLQTVSDNIKSDLTQRQYSEVAVTVTPAPKNSAAFSNDPQQGRGRQQGREQEDQQPGRALADAGNTSSATSMFSLG